MCKHSVTLANVCALFFVEINSADNHSPMIWRIQFLIEAGFVSVVGLHTSRLFIETKDIFSKLFGYNLRIIFSKY
jgi:hypothetical protein